MNDKQRLKQARREYDELTAKLLHYRIPQVLSAEGQFELSVAMLKLKKTLNPDSVTKALVAVHKRKGKKS